MDAVSSKEAAAVEEHLAVCGRCRDEVAQYQKGAAMLAEGGGDAPAGLWDGIAARISEVSPVEQPVPRPQPTPTTPRPKAGRFRRRPRRWPRFGATFAAAVAVVIAALGVEVGRLDHRLGQLASAKGAPTLSAAVENTLLDPQARRFVLNSTGPGGRRAAEVVVLPTGGGYLFNTAMPALAATATYQLWAMIDGQAISIGLLGRHPSAVAFNMDPANPTTAFAVTVEAVGGSVAPTRSPTASTTL